MDKGPRDESGVTVQFTRYVYIEQAFVNETKGQSRECDERLVHAKGCGPAVKYVPHMRINAR